MPDVIHRNLADGELHLPNTVVSTYAALLLLAGPFRNSELAYITATGQRWRYDTSLPAWRADTPFITVTGSLFSIVGAQPGDLAFTTDSSQLWVRDVSTWNLVGGSFTFLDPVLDKDLTVPPGSPSPGDRYIVGVGAVGDWAGHDNEIATWESTVWSFFAPSEGDLTYVDDENLYYLFTGSVWTPFVSATPLTTKGDIYSYDTAPTRFPAAGTTGKALVSNTGAAFGMVWGEYNKTPSVITPAAISGLADNYAPTGVNEADVIRASSNGAPFGGLLAPTTTYNVFKHFVNVGSFSFVLLNEQVSSDPANRFLGPNNLEPLQLRPSEGCMLWYDVTSSRWRMLYKTVNNLNYLLLDGSVSMSGALNMGYNTILQRGWNIISPAALSGTTNDYSPSNFLAADILRLSSTGDQDLTGMSRSGGSGGMTDRKLIINVGSDVITLKNEDGASTDVFRFACPDDQDLSLLPNCSTFCHYDWTTERWRVLDETIFFGKKTPNEALDAISTQGADVSSAGTLDLESATGACVDVTGNTTVTAITLDEGHVRTVRFTDALTLTNGATLVLPTGADLVTAAGDYAVFRGYSAGIVRCVAYMRATGKPLSGSEVQIYDTAGTYVWTRPAWATTAHVICLGAGGGGGSGRCGAAGTVRCGGGGGASGRTAEAVIALQNTTYADIQVGAGGTGGASVTVNDTDGNDGVPGQSSYFRIEGSSSNALNADGGAKGSGGTATSGTGGSVGGWGSVAGGSASASGGNGSSGGSSNQIGYRSGAGGGGGGGITSGDVLSNGATGGNNGGYGSNGSVGAAGTVGASRDGGSPVQGALVTNGFLINGTRGGGGGAAHATVAETAGNGGDGVTCDGGGGGGAALNGTNSGAGGAGGDGMVMVVAY